MTEHAVCDYCARLRKVDPTGRIARHFTRIPERVRATSRTRQVRRQCPGSGRLSRRVER